MKSRRRGAHSFLGKENDRWGRTRSKINIPKEDMTENFKEIDEETYRAKKNKWLDEAHERGNDYY